MNKIKLKPVDFLLERLERVIYEYDLVIYKQAIYRAMIKQLSVGEFFINKKELEDDTQNCVYLTGCDKYGFSYNKEYIDNYE